MKRNEGRSSGPLKRKAAHLALAVFLFVAVGLAASAASVFAGAGAPDLGLNAAAGIGLSTTDIRTLISRVIRAFLALLGIIAVALIMYAGFLWMTARGNEEQVLKAKRIITQAVIGLIIILSAYAIVLFILRVVTGDLGPGGGTSGAPSRFDTLFSQNRGQDALGNGIIEYHYPEVGQTDVFRNTKLSITFKKPLALSTIFKDYDDKNTFDPADDVLCDPGQTPPACTGASVNPYATPAPLLQLNTANIRLIAIESLDDVGSGTVDEQYENRHPIGDVVPATAKVTTVAFPLDPTQYQTVVFKPLTPIGSPTADVNYRVSLRGCASDDIEQCDLGLKVWDAEPATNEPIRRNAFRAFYPDGGYYWTFTTGTLIDNTPPQIQYLIPYPTTVPGTPPATVLDRNQLLQIYFDEAVDPTTASGVIGAGGGFTNVQVQAKCRVGLPCETSTYGDWATVNGTLFLGNRNRTAEFTPNTICDTYAENSCGEQVYCLPKNTDLRVRALAATVGGEPPAAIEDNGIEDMAGNSLDGNKDGAAQGPQSPDAQPNPPTIPGAPAGRPLDYSYNDPPTDPAVLAQTSDTAKWLYQVGSNVDLVAPIVTLLDPPPPPPESAEHPTGPSMVPPDLEPSLRFSKSMSISAMRTGGFDRETGDYVLASSTLVLRLSECAKLSTDVCAATCPCEQVDPPGFSYQADILAPGGPGTEVSIIKLKHQNRQFYSGNDLGYTREELLAFPDNIPTVLPIARAQLRDSKQNCFWPSVFKPTTDECQLVGAQTSCCDKDAMADNNFLSQCAPPDP